MYWWHESCKEGRGTWKESRLPLHAYRTWTMAIEIYFSIRFRLLHLFFFFLSSLLLLNNFELKSPHQLDLKFTFSFGLKSHLKKPKSDVMFLSLVYFLGKIPWKVIWVRFFQPYSVSNTYPLCTWVVPMRSKHTHHLSYGLGTNAPRIRTLSESYPTLNRHTRVS